jgi:hypothetical protein
VDLWVRYDFRKTNSDDDNDGNTSLSFQSPDPKYLSQIIMQLEPNHAGRTPEEGKTTLIGLKNIYIYNSGFEQM